MPEMLEFVKFTSPCTAQITVTKIIKSKSKDEKIMSKKIIIPEGWWFYLYGKIKNGKYNIGPIKASGKTSMIFNDDDKESFKQGFWKNVKDLTVLRQLEIEKCDLSSREIRVNLTAYADPKKFELFELEM